MDGFALSEAQFPAMSSVLALRNLLHDRIRLVVTLVGIVFAVVLINVQVGLFLGFAKTASSLIDHSGADLWIMPLGTRDVDQVEPMSDRKIYQALAVPGVERASGLNVEFAYFKKPDGGTESTLIVGFDLATGFGGPWNVSEGDVRSLRFPDTIMIDQFYREKLGVTHLGQVVEIGGHRARVVGFTEGIRSFTQSPYVFTSNRTALDYSRIQENQTKYVLISLLPGADLRFVKSELAKRVPGVEIKTGAQFSRQTQFYWLFTTGAGSALLLAAVMGLAVGVVIVSQTLYATTVDHLPEFGTLRAIGASSRYIYGVIIRQAVLSALVGYTVGLLITVLIVHWVRDLGPVILLPAWMMALMLVLTVVMCVGAALISIKKVTRLDPTAVFK